jgi:hypothetical protein
MAGDLTSRKLRLRPPKPEPVTSAPAKIRWKTSARPVQPPQTPHNPFAQSGITDTEKDELLDALCRQPHGCIIVQNVLSKEFLEEIAPNFRRWINNNSTPLFGKKPHNVRVSESKRKQWVMAKRDVRPLRRWVGADDEEEYVGYLRFEEEAAWAEHVVDQVTAALVNLRVIHKIFHTCDGVALLCAEEGAPRQHAHADMKSRAWQIDRLFSRVEAQDGCTPFPVSVMVATSAGGATLSTPEGVIHVPQYGCVVFRGDLIHAGSAYTAENFRIHLYFGYSQTFGNGETVVRSVPTSVNKRGDDRDTVIIVKKEEENNSFFDAKKGRKKYENAYPNMTWQG